MTAPRPLGLRRAPRERLYCYGCGYSRRMDRPHRCRRPLLDATQPARRIGPRAVVSALVIAAFVVGGLVYRWALVAAQRVVG